MAMDIRALLPGTVIHNRYKVEKVLGSGGFGVTYKVYDQKENKIAALKEYMPLDAAYRPVGSKEVRPVSEGKREQYEKFRQQFLEEAQTIYKFRGHPNIVEVTHLFYENNTAYYVMEYVEGMDLKQFLKSQGGKISWDMLKPILAQVVAGLKQVHSGGMIHCDISPDNIFLMNSGSVKILDFGAARSTLRGSVETSVIVAKPGYSPYEQMRGKKMGPWTDIYALAVTVYRSVTGEMVRDSNERIINDKTIWPSQMGIAIPSAAWEAALKKGMAVRAEDRYQNVMDFWNGLLGGIQTFPPPNPYSQQVVNDQRTWQQNSYSAPMPGLAPGGCIIKWVQGVFVNQTMAVNQDMCMGVDKSKCHFAFPVGTPGISRLHLRLWPQNGMLCVMDMGSTYGTWINGKKMTPGLVYQAPTGSVIYMGGGQVFQTL